MSERYVEAQGLSTIQATIFFTYYKYTTLQTAQMMIIWTLLLIELYYGKFSKGHTEVELYWNVTLPSINLVTFCRFRGLFSRKSKEGSDDEQIGWKLFGKVPPKQVNGKDPNQIQAEYKVENISIVSHTNTPMYTKEPVICKMEDHKKKSIISTDIILLYKILEINIYTLHNFSLLLLNLIEEKKNNVTSITSVLCKRKSFCCT